MYTLFTRLMDGELILVASREDVNQAVHLAHSLNASWPREYVVQDPLGNRFIPEELRRDFNASLAQNKIQ
jgi:hypothetical protein